MNPEQEPKIEEVNPADEQIIEVMAQEVGDVVRNNLQKIVSGEIDSEEAKTRTINEIEDVLNKKFDWSKVKK